MEYLTLYNNIKLPQLGYGCAAIGKFGESSDIVTSTIVEAINVGYRHFDTAAIYNTEQNLGDAIKRSGLPREDFFIVTKLQPTDMNPDTAHKAAELSLKKLNTDYIDLYLIHWPLKESYIKTWKVLESLYEQGVVKSIGGSNFGIKHIDGIASSSNIKPMFNQVELNPYMQQNELREYCRKENIALTAWSPLGTGNWSDAKPEDKPLGSSVIKEIASKYNKSSAQTILRWLMDIGVAAVPKSEKPHRIKENFDIFDFKLNEEDIKSISSENRNYSISAAFSEGNRELYSRI